MIKELENKIGQLQYEISLLEHSEEELTGVTNRTDELKNLVKKLTIPVVTKRNWFEKLPLHWKLAYHLIGGIIIGYLLHYVW